MGAKEIPNFNKNCPVRMTTASILREDALFQKEQAKQAQLLKEYEVTLMDSTDFDEWKENELQTMEIGKIRLIAERKHEMQQSAVNAKAAVETDKAQKYISAQQMNVEAMKTLAVKKEIDRRMLCQKVELAAKIKLEHENAAVAVREHEAQNKEIRDIVKEQKAHNLVIKKEKMEKELKRKRDLISMIQKMEKDALEKIKSSKEAFDRSTSSKIGLLCEMSILELQHKVESLKAAEIKAKEERRTNILTAKQEKHTMILMKARNLSKRRAQKKADSKAERAKKLAQAKLFADEKKKKHEKTVLAMADKLENGQRIKLEQAKQQKAEIKKVLAMQKEWKTNSNQVEKLNWMNYNDGLERIVKAKQKKKFNDAKSEVERKQKLEKQRKMNLSKKQKEKQGNIDRYDLEATTSKNMSQRIGKTEMKAKQTRFEQMRGMKKDARSKYLDSKPYEQKMEEMRGSTS